MLLVVCLLSRDVIGYEGSKYKKVIIYLSMAYRCHRFFFFFFCFFFFFQWKKRSCRAYVQLKKQTKQNKKITTTKNKQKQRLWAYRCHRPEFLWGVLFKMATRTIVKKTKELKEVLSRYVKQNFRWNELLDFGSRDCGEYAWSLRALDRGLEFFSGITWHIPIEPLR